MFSVEKTEGLCEQFLGLFCYLVSVLICCSTRLAARQTPP